MRTHVERNGGVGDAAKEVAEHASSLARLEIELASLELKRKVGTLGMGVGLVVAGATLGLFGLGFVFATIAAALATFLPTWLALLVVTIVLLLGAGLLAFFGVGAIKKATPPVPEQAIREAKLTSEVLRG
jgi:hypothetical protein